MGNIGNIFIVSWLKVNERKVLSWEQKTYFFKKGNSRWNLFSGLIVKEE